MHTIIKRLRNTFSSLYLTIFLLFFSMVLVFLGTLDQVHLGIHEAQKKYFESFYATWSYPANAPFQSLFSWVTLTLPGGYTLGITLLINLVCAHFKYFRPSKKKIGITIIHAGVVLLLISGFTTSMFQQEGQMWIHEGETKNYSQSMRENELVLINKSHPDKDIVTSIPEELLTNGSPFTHADLPFNVSIKGYYPNADLALKSQNPDLKTPKEMPKATHGAAVKMGLLSIPKARTYKEDEANAATAYVMLSDTEGEIGTWLVSNIMDDRFPPQTFEINGSKYEIAMRFKRTYYPYSIHLIDFNHERYPGTQIPKDFSSLVRIQNPETGEDRETLIYMNNPLRHEGTTFFQASFTPDDSASMLQVVQNPTRILPYIAVLLVGLGLIVQFSFHLIRFIKRS